jgi:hypothetical protein
MNILRVFVVTLLLLAFGRVATAQETPKAVLADEFANLFCSEDNRSRMDNFLALLSQKTDSIGYVLGSADKSIPGRFSTYFTTFQNHVVNRKFDSNRVKFFRVPDSNAMHFQFWIVPKGATPPEFPASFVSSKLESATLFDSSEIYRLENGSVNFGDDGGDAVEPCDWGLDLNRFAMWLNADTNLSGYLIASSKNSLDAAKAKIALRLTEKTLVKEHGVAPRRLKTMYVGLRKGTEMQLWLVPKNGSVPELREGTAR